MKKFFIAMLLAATLTTTAFATDENQVGERTLARFTYEFGKVDNVRWKVKPDFVRATFTQDGKILEAFFDYNGDFLGCSHAIQLDELPTSAKRIFAKKYSNYTVKEAIKFDAPEYTAYYMSAENDKELLVLKVENGFLSVFKKTSKK